MASSNAFVNSSGTHWSPATVNLLLQSFGILVCLFFLLLSLKRVHGVFIWPPLSLEVALVGGVTFQVLDGGGGVGKPFLPQGSEFEP
jgi:hypothetical protein